MRKKDPAAGEARRALLSGLFSTVLSAFLTLVTTLFVLEGAAVASAAAIAAGEREIDDAICADAQRAGDWNLAWGTVFGAAAIGSASYAALAPRRSLDEDHRAGFYVTATKASVGVLAKLVEPLWIDAGRLCLDTKGASKSARRGLLAEAARRESRVLQTNILGGLALNTAGLLYLGYGRDAWGIAWVSFGIGTAVSIATTLTMPLESWLLKRRLDRGAALTMVPSFDGRSSGVALAGTW